MPNSEITIYGSEDYYRLVQFMSDFNDFACKIKDNFDIYQIGYNGDTDQFWIAFEDDFSFGEKTGFVYTDPNDGKELVFGKNADKVIGFLKKKQHWNQE